MVTIVDRIRPEVNFVPISLWVVEWSCCLVDLISDLSVPHDSILHEFGSDEEKTRRPRLMRRQAAYLSKRKAW